MNGDPSYAWVAYAERGPTVQEVRDGKSPVRHVHVSRTRIDTERAAARHALRSAALDVGPAVTSTRVVTSKQLIRWERTGDFDKHGNERLINPHLGGTVTVVVGLTS